MTIDNAGFLEPLTYYASLETSSHWNKAQLSMPLALLTRAPSITKHQQYNPHSHNQLTEDFPLSQLGCLAHQRPPPWPCEHLLAPAPPV